MLRCRLSSLLGIKVEHCQLDPGKLSNSDAITAGACTQEYTAFCYCASCQKRVSCERMRTLPVLLNQQGMRISAQADRPSVARVDPATDRSRNQTL
jgi:hypothetical protein